MLVDDKFHYSSFLFLLREQSRKNVPRREINEEKRHNLPRKSTVLMCEWSKLLRVDASE